MPQEHPTPRKETTSNVPFDQFLANPHFLEQRRVSDNPRRILDLAACFVEASDDANNRAFHDICQVSNAVERHAARPFVHDLDHTETGLADEIVGVVGRQDDLVQGLDLVHFFGDLDDLSDAALKAGSEGGLRGGFFLKDEGGEKGDDFFRLVFCKYIFEDEFGENKLVGRVNLRSC